MGAQPSHGESKHEQWSIGREPRAYLHKKLGPRAAC